MTRRQKIWQAVAILIGIALILLGVKLASGATLTNQPYSAVWVWSYPGTNLGQQFAFFLNSNGVSVRYIETTNTRVTITNLTGSVWAWSVEIYSVGNGQPAIWLPTNYMRALFATNREGPWIELPATTMTSFPPTGFLRWSNFNNLAFTKP